MREARAHAAHRDEEVQAVHLLRADRLRHLARALAQVALDRVRLLRLRGHRGEDPVLVHAALAQEDLGAVRDGEEREELMGARELLADARRDVRRLREDLRELHRLDHLGHVAATMRYRR